jgi:hypothetical protein
MLLGGHAMRGACVLLLTCLALAGCRRKPPPPSPDYAQASTLYQQLYATQLDDAYGNPRMAEVEAGLRRVDPRSADARAAQDLLATIEHGREDFAKAQEQRRQIGAISAADLKKTSNIDPQAVLAAREPPDAGETQDPTGTGASIADLNRESGGCLVAYQPFREEGTGKVGQLYKLAPSAVCKDKLPGFIGQAAMVVDGKIYRRIPTPAAAAQGSDAGIEGPPADAGTKPPPKAAATPKLPEGARLVSVDPDGTQHYQVPAVNLIPGMPTGEIGAAVANAPPPASDALPDATPHPPPPDASGGSGY